MFAAFNGRGGITLAAVIETLQRLQDNPELLARDRSALNDPPPPYKSGETTQPPSPPPFTEADRRRERQRRKEERLNSMPEPQLRYQRSIEVDRLLDQSLRQRSRRKNTLPFDKELDFGTNALNNVINRWKEQGIYSPRWKAQPFGPRRWEHEESPEPDLEPEHEAGIQSPLHPGPTLGPPKPRWKNVSAECIAAHERKTRASRPYYQFLFQLSKEREWLEDELDIEPSEIDTKAYNYVKNHWLAQKIWNPKWGHMPGLTWIHEEPDDDDESDSENLDNPPADESGRHNAVENDGRPAPRVRYRYRTDGFGLVEVRSDSPEPSGDAALSLTCRTRVGSNGDVSTYQNASNLPDPVPQSLRNTKEPQESSRLAPDSNGTSNVRKRATRDSPDSPESTPFRSRKRLHSTFEPASGPQSPVPHATGIISGEDKDPEPSVSTSSLGYIVLDEGSGEDRQPPLRNSRISTRSRTNKRSVSCDASVDTNKISQLSSRRNRRASSETRTTPPKPLVVSKNNPSGRPRSSG
ncbi:hypothetical protein GX51_03803 [Blastomyces parvus]|uniref:Uncharacterized protein n=1 Tax=Blastomyces parvus TaxID=2060905 RepID=A0A2B7X4I0_9EURO|nr:hypothetical protein GX51_03803 [Blastomyces parvus]